MKTLLLLLVLIGAASSRAGETNAPAPVAVPAKTPEGTAIPKAIVPDGGLAVGNPAATATSPGATSVALPSEVLPKPEPKIPVDGIEGRRFDYTGAGPKAVKAVKAGGVRGVLNLFNPFAKLTPAEAPRDLDVRDRPLPRGFVDYQDVQPVGIKLISVESK